MPQAACFPSVEVMAQRMNLMVHNKHGEIKEDKVMKRYMKSFCALSILLMAVITFVSCTKDEEPAPVGKTFTLTVNASKGGDKATKALSLVGNTLNATWAEGERVTVYNVTKDAALEGYLEAQSSGASTTLKGTLTGAIANGDKLLLKFLSPSYSSQDGTLAYIAANCDYAEATVTVSDASTPSVTTSAASFTNQQAIVKFTLKDKGNNDAAINATELRVSDGTNTYIVTPASGTSEIFVALPGGSGITVSLTVFSGDDTYFYRKSNVTFTNGQYYEIGVKMTKVEYVDLGLLSGTKWATFNLGATKPEEYGDYYAWGATETWYSCLSPSVEWKTGKEEGYVTANAPYYNNGSWTKYTTNTDNLQTEDDAAYVNWGSNWRIPTETQWLELFSECDCVAATENGVNGYKVTSKTNGNYIFLPSAGIFGVSLGQVGTNPFYFTASLGYLHEELYAMYAAPNANTTYHTGRYFGMSVRPVRVH